MISDTDESSDNRVAERIVIALVLLLGAMCVGVAWRNVDLLTSWWLASLVAGTIAYFAALGLLATRSRRRFGFAVICVSALTLPTGFAAIFNLVLLLLALPAAIVFGRE